MAMHDTVVESRHNDVQEIFRQPNCCLQEVINTLLIIKFTKVLYTPQHIRIFLSVQSVIQIQHFTLGGKLNRDVIRLQREKRTDSSEFNNYWLNHVGATNVCAELVSNWFQPQSQFWSTLVPLIFVGTTKAYGYHWSSVSSTVSHRIRSRHKCDPLLEWWY